MNRNLSFVLFSKMSLEKSANRIIALLSFVVILAMPGLCLADAAGGEAGEESVRGKELFSSPSIAVVDVREVLSNCEEWDDWREDMEGRRKKMESTLGKMERRIRTLKMDYDNLPPGTERARSKREEVQSAVQEYQESGQQLKKELIEMRARVLSDMLDRLNKAVAKYAQKNDIDIVFKMNQAMESDSQTLQGAQAILRHAETADVIYADDRYDISERIIERLDASYADPVSANPSK